MRKIIIVSSGQPSANPRMTKEAIALSAAGYKINVLYCPLSPWADIYDKALFQLYPEIEWIRVGYHPLNEKWKYFYARMRQKINHILFKSFGNVFDAAIRSMVLFSQELMQEAKRQNGDLYIGHNLGALPAVVKAAGKNAAFASFDFEDFHRGEADEGSLHWKKTKQIEEKYVPLLTYATAASPLIAKAYQNIFSTLSFTPIGNCFPVSYAVNEPELLPIEPLKLFWFSQTIGAKRGLETAIEAMGKMKNKNAELSLLGNCTAETKNYMLAIAKKNGLNVDQVKFLPPVSESEIVGIAAVHHIGLACEDTHILNREICLTNKIFMYLLAANAIVFSNTRAQYLFQQEHPGLAVVYEQNDAKQLAAFLDGYINDPLLLQQHREASLKLAKEQMNWETEKQKLLKKINEVLH